MCELIDKNKCQCCTGSGTQCTRKPTQGDYCTQHFKMMCKIHAKQTTTRSPRPYDIIDTASVGHIASFLDTKSLASLARVNKKSLQGTKHQLTERKIKAEIKKILASLNLLGSFFHGWYGIYQGEPEINIDDIDLLNLIQVLVKKSLFTAQDPNTYGFINQLKLNESYILHMYVQGETYCKRLLETEVKFSKVVIMSDGWRDPTENWYNLEDFADKPTDPRGLPLLSEKPYIYVVDPFKQVRIDGEKKRRAITYFDILFASTALMGDPYHSPRFEMIDGTPDILTLRVTFT